MDFDQYKTTKFADIPIGATYRRAGTDDGDRFIVQGHRLEGHHGQYPAILFDRVGGRSFEHGDLTPATFRRRYVPA